MEPNEQNNSGGQQQSAAPAPTIDPEVLRSTMREVFSEQSEQDPPEQQMTQDELDKAMAVWKPDKAFVDKFRRINAEDAKDDELLEPFVHMRSGLMGQAQKYTDLQMERVQNAMMQRFAPLMQHYQDTVRAKHETDFYSEYPELKEFPEIVQAVAMKLRGTKTKDASEARKILAENVAKVLTKVRPDFQLSQSSQKPGQSNGGMPPMASISQGSTQGGGGAPKGDSIWD